MAFRDGREVYVVEQDTLLVIRPATLLQEIGGDVFVAADISPGDDIVVNPLDIVTDSMTVEIANGDDR